MSYLDHTSAAPIAAAMPAALLSAYLALSSADKDTYLAQASQDVDAASRWQGRKFDPDQAGEFPRIAYPSAIRSGLGMGDSYGDANISASLDLTDMTLIQGIWDWDPTNLVAIVPPKVLTAVIWQADYLARGGSAQRLDDQHEGVRDQMTGGLRETYAATGHQTGLSRRAWSLMRIYQLVTGRML